MQLDPLQISQLFQSPLMQALSAPLKAAIAEQSELVKLPKGAYVHRKGDAFTGIYILLNGTLKAMGVTAKGYAYSLTQINPGTVFGEVAFIDGGDRTHDAVCIQNSELARLAPKQLSQLTQEFDDFYPAMAKLACLHIRQSFAVVDDFLTLSPEQRMAKRLAELALEGSECSQLISLKQEELAAWVGISRQSVNKTLRKWERLSWIKITYGGIEILSLDALTALIES